MTIFTLNEASLLRPPASVLVHLTVDAQRPVANKSAIIIVIYNMGVFIVT